MTPFRKALEHAINSHSKENGSNTPDFILAAYLEDCLATFDKALAAREKWYGRGPGNGPGQPANVPDDTTVINQSVDGARPITKWDPPSNLKEGGAY